MSKETTRRNVLKSIGATATATTVASFPVSAASTVDYPRTFISQNVYDNYSRYDVMQPTNTVLLSALPGSQASAETVYPDVSSASSLDEAHSQFKTFLSNMNLDPSSDTNVLIVDETKFDNSVYEADSSGNATTVAGAKHFDEYHKQNDDPGQYGDNEAYRRWWSMLIGVGLNYGCSYGQGVTYKDSSITDQYDYVRTPMIVYSQDGTKKTTNNCGDTTYRISEQATYELRYSDCSMATIESNN